MSVTRRDEAALAAMTRAFRRGWPARIVEKAGPGWSELFLVALRSDPAGRSAVAAALLDEDALASALERAGLLAASADAAEAARAVIAALGNGPSTAE